MLTALKRFKAPSALLFLISTCMASGLAYSAPTGVTSISTVEGVTEYQLDNGLTVLLAPDESRSNTTVNMTYLVGSRHENYGQTGMAHLLEHMLFRGTPDMPNALGEFSKRGLAANGTTSVDRTNYYATFAANDDTLNWYLDWQADVMTNATISQADLDAEMTVVRNEMERGENSPIRVLMQKMQAAAFQWHNYGKSTIGARSDVEQVDVEQLRLFYQTYYQPDNAVLIVSGRFDADSTLAHISKQFNAIAKPTRTLPPEYTTEPVQDGTRLVSLKRQGGSPLVAAQYHIPAEADPQFLPLSLGVSILSSTPSGALYKDLVEQELSTSVFGFAAGLRHPGYALFMAELNESMSPDHALTALNQSIESQYATIQTEDLNRIRSQWLNAWAQSYADPARLAAALSESAAAGDWRLFFWERDQVEQIELETVKTALSTWLVADNRTNGLYIPTDKPTRAPQAQAPDLDVLLANYEGKQTDTLVDLFDPTPEAINQHTLREQLQLDNSLGTIDLALLAKPTRGNRVHASLSLRFATPDQLKNKQFIGAATASLLDHGTQQYSRQQLEDQLTALNSSVSFAGGPNQLKVNIETTEDNLVPTIELIAEIIREATFPEKELEKYKAQQITRIHNARTEPTALAAQALSRHFNTWSSDDIRYTPSFDESIQGIQALDAQALKEFHQQFYGTGNIRFAATGSLDAEAVKAALIKGFNNWRAAPAFERAADPYHATPTEHLVLDTPDKANAFYLATMPLELQDTDEDFIALYLANYLLGQSETSRLWNRVRVKEGLSYDVRSRLNVSSYEPTASWTVYAIHAPENSAKLQQTLTEELELALNEGFSAEEVASGIDALLRYRRLARSNDATLTNTWLSYLDLDRDFLWSAQVDTALEALDAKQVNAALKKYLKLDQFSSALAADTAKQ